MRKILVIGSGGSGKSTFAARLGARLNLEVLHLDKFYWQPGWVEPPKAEWSKTVEDLIKRDGWIMDGNYSGTLGVRLAAADTVIWLDMPRVLCLWRILKRRAKYRNIVRPDMGAGCPEQFSLEFARWVWNYPRRSRPKVLALLKEHGAGKKIVRLRSHSEVEKFLVQSVE